MGSEENKAIVRRWFEEVWNQRNVAAIDALAAETFKLYHSAMPSGMDLQTYKRYHPAFMAAFPDLRMEIDDIIAEGDRVAVRITQRPRMKGSSWAFHPLVSR
jgi:predicted ester cyclase